MSNAAHILIVDDEPNVRLVFETALATNDYVIATAADGAAALESLQRTPIDLILLDLNMPVMGGMEVLERLRASGSHIPVIIVTAHGSVPDAVHAMKLGAIDFLSKPITPDALRKIVADVLARHASDHSQTDSTPEPVTVASEFLEKIRKAKQAINRRWFNEAEIYLKEAIALKTGSAEAHNLLGVLYELRGDFKNCFHEYKLSLKHDHHYEPAKQNMTRYYELYTFGRSQTPVDLGPD